MKDEEDVTLYTDESGEKRLLSEKAA